MAWWPTKSSSPWRNRRNGVTRSWLWTNLAPTRKDSLWTSRNSTVKSSDPLIPWRLRGTPSRTLNRLDSFLRWMPATDIGKSPSAKRRVLSQRSSPHGDVTGTYVTPKVSCRLVMGLTAAWTHRSTTLTTSESCGRLPGVRWQFSGACRQS